MTKNDDPVPDEHLPKQPTDPTSKARERALIAMLVAFGLLWAPTYGQTTGG